MREKKRPVARVINGNNGLRVSVFNYLARTVVYSFAGSVLSFPLSRRRRTQRCCCCCCCCRHRLSARLRWVGRQNVQREGRAREHGMGQTERRGRGLWTCGEFWHSNCIHHVQPSSPELTVSPTARHPLCHARPSRQSQESSDRRRCHGRDWESKGTTTWQLRGSNPPRPSHTHVKPSSFLQASCPLRPLHSQSITRGGLSLFSYHHASCHAAAISCWLGRPTLHDHPQTPSPWPVQCPLRWARALPPIPASCSGPHD